MTTNKPFKYFNTAIAAAVVTSGVAVVAPQATEATELKFLDVKVGAYYYDAVMSLAERGIVNGYPDGTYGPEKSITRGQVAVILANALGLDTYDVTDPGFKDVPKSHDYYSAIAALANAGYINGYEDDTYKPSQPISRYHMALILAAAYNLEATDVDALPFTDVKNDYKAQVAALYENGVTAGKTTTTFGGNQKVTRGQMALFIAAAEEAAYPSITVSEIKDSKILTTDGEVYKFSEDLAGIFSEANDAALKDAEIGLIIENGVVVDVYYLILNASGTESAPVVFDGVDSLILGDLFVNADWMEVKNLTVIGDLYLTEEVVNSFSTDMVDVLGDVYVLETEESAVASLDHTFVVNASATAPKLNLVDSSVNSIEANRNNLVITSNTVIPEVRVAENVNSIELNAEVEAVTVNNAESVQISGTGTINNLTVKEAAQVTLNVPGQVKELVVANKDAKVSLGDNVTVGKLVVPAGSDFSTIIDNYNNLKENITEVVNEEGAEIDTTVVSVSTIEGFRVALADTHIKTINLTANLENVSERIVVDRAVTINGGEHTISFTNDINELAYGSRQGITVVADDVQINDLAVTLTEKAEWQGAYAVQVYNAQNVLLNNITTSGADAGLLVNAAEVELTGTTTVSGNEFGGIEVSKGTEEGLSNADLIVNGSIANETEAYGEPTIWLVHNQDPAKTAQGTVAGSGLDGTVVNYLDKVDGYQTQYFMQNAPVQIVSMEGKTTSLDSMNLASIEVIAQSEKELYELEVDHNITGLPEFSVYASEENPYGSEEAKAQFEALGVMVTYNAEAKKWTIEFGSEISNQLIAQEDVTFYVVIADQNKYTFGSMFNTTSQNTLKLQF
ncbi:S-layer homology domain-containing protein [Lysinibacillus sp. SGAir0095]|uniref:S-layer homology domain-containing protein n=1 Tax=Lysinibacillus sp. SGAir0095 TaxID=2070463 RepID=UPI0010CD2FA7|nr:S-layer homology domain-containing protein [Lysinibacillus sp. SGAir0095]QCR31454.1 hypothetical protein C1N55_04420 [Lysinibacillus sp. SGAir0095]